jgi:hypothetical protein
MNFDIESSYRSLKCSVAKSLNFISYSYITDGLRDL